MLTLLKLITAKLFSEYPGLSTTRYQCTNPSILAKDGTKKKIIVISIPMKSWDKSGVETVIIDDHGLQVMIDTKRNQLITED